MSHIFDLLYRKVGVRWDALVSLPYVNDDHHRTRDELLEQIIDLLVRRAQLWSRMIPPNHPLPSYKRQFTHLAH